MLLLLLLLLLLLFLVLLELLFFYIVVVVGIGVLFAVAVVVVVINFVLATKTISTIEINTFVYCLRRSRSSARPQRSISRSQSAVGFRGG